MSRFNASVVEELAPPSPPCFSGRRVWVLYLESAAEATKPGRGAVGPIVSINGQPVFNRGLNYCLDCDPRHKREMTAAGRCNPDFLHDDNVLVVPTQPVNPALGADIQPKNRSVVGLVVDVEFA